MDVLAAVLACSLHADDGLVRAIVESASQGNAFAVVDRAPEVEPEQAPAPHSEEEALARSAQIVARGGTPLFGLMQIPKAWSEMYGRSTRELFDPCVNVSIGTAMLSWFDRDCRQGPRARRPKAKTARAAAWDTGAVGRRGCVLAKYGEVTGSVDLETAVRYELAGQKALTRAIHSVAGEAPILFAVRPASGWGANQMFFQPIGEGAWASPAR